VWDPAAKLEEYIAHRLARESALVAALDAGLLDLSDTDQDPRRAVIAAYARLERVLAAFGLARRPAETPQEYRGRSSRGSSASVDRSGGSPTSSHGLSSRSMRSMQA
jgi:hypothetical protein